jgi:hypothetical protein
MNLTQILSNPTALVSLLCIVGFVVAVNLPLLFPIGLGKIFEREAKTWSKALRNGSDVSERNAKQIDDLHKQVEDLKKPPTTPES